MQYASPMVTSPPRVDSPALRTVATAFLRRRPFIVAPMLALVVATLALGSGPASQALAVSLMGGAALTFFFFEAARGRRRTVTSRGLLVSLFVTILGITCASAATGGAASPVAVMLLAPTAVGFAAFGRGRTSDVLLATAVLALIGLALLSSLLPAGVPFPPLSDDARRWLFVACAVDALVLLRVGVAALGDAHAAASAAATGAADDVVAAAQARGAALEAMGARVAHEVRNPLSAVRGLAELLAERAQEPRDRERLTVMLSEVDRLDGILSEYLALARPLDRLEPAPTELATLVREVAAIAEARAERAQIALSVEAEAARVAVDPRRIKEALLNLVLNALDHTPAGGRVTLRVQPATSGGAILSVDDTGPGMTPAQLAVAGTAYVSGRAGGTGLGLALVRQTVHQHGGTLDLTSAPGRGTVARVLLPAQPAASQQPISETP